MARWYKEGYFWRRDDGDNPDKDGDLVFNTLTKIIMDEDASSWALIAFGGCASLLRDKKRWANYMNTGKEAPNRWVWYPYRFVMKTLQRMGLNVKFRWTRPQSDLTRDPFIALGACYAFLMFCHHEEHGTQLTKTFEMTKPPWYLYRYNTWTWRKRLLNHKAEFYVKRLRYLRALATVDNFERQHKLWKDDE